MRVLTFLLMASGVVLAVERPDLTALKWSQMKLTDGRILEEPVVERIDSRGAWIRADGHLDLVEFRLLEEPQKAKIVNAFLELEEWQKANPPKVSDGTELEAMRRAEQDMLARLQSGKSGLVWVNGQGLKVLEVRNETPVGAMLLHAGGITQVKFADLSREEQEAFGYEPMLANRWPYLSQAEKAREKAAWFERRRLKQEAQAKATGRE